MIRRVWPLIVKARVDFRGHSFDEWVQAFPTPDGRFVVVVQLIHGWKAYFVDSFDEIADAVRQAIIDSRIMANGSPGDVNFSVRIVEVGNLWVGHRNAVSDGLEYELPPLNDVYSDVKPFSE